MSHVFLDRSESSLGFFLISINLYNKEDGVSLVNTRTQRDDAVLIHQKTARHSINGLFRYF